MIFLKRIIILFFVSSFSTLFGQTITLSSKDYFLENGDLDQLYVTIKVKQDFLHCHLAIKGRKQKIIKRFKDVVLPRNKRRTFDLGYQFLYDQHSNINVEISNCKNIRPIRTINPRFSSPDDIDQLIDKSINFLVKRQKKKSDGQNYYKGEWGSLMKARKGFAVLRTKKGTTAYDSNCFTTSSIVNSLAELHKSNKLTEAQKDKIRSMLELALNDVLACEDGGTFNFWHLVDIPQHLTREGKLNRVRSPNHFPYQKRIFYFFSNIVNDADDTAIAYLALDNIKNILGIDKKPYQEIGKLFSPFRDFRSRNVFNLYDFVAFRAKNTNAFMTWLTHDEFKVPFLPSFKKQNIPLRTNDVDCVVNSNILASLARYNELETPGVKTSCKYINKQLKKKNFSKCALYYPNQYMLPYAVSKAMKEGAKCLKPSTKRIRDIVLSTQKSDGSWDSFKEYDDLVQSTVLAINTLINLDDESEVISIAIMRGVQFLLNEVIIEGDFARWPGGIYFSGGTFARKRIVWTSDAYTTGLVLEVLTKYKELFY